MLTKEILNYNEFSKLILLFISINCYVWTIYGLEKNDFIIWSINVIGFIINIVFIYIYTFYLC